MKMGRQKKGVIFILAVLLFMIFCNAGAEGFTAGQMMKCYTGLSGNVTFALPGQPTYLVEGDYAGHYKNSRVLLGVCVEDGTPFTLHSADISEWIEMLAEDSKDLKSPPSEQAIRLEALERYAMLGLEAQNAEITDRKYYGTPSGDELIAYVTFHFPESPDVPRYCCARLKGNLATSLDFVSCIHSQEMIDSFSFLDEGEQLETVRSRLSEREKVDIHGLVLSLPGTRMKKKEEEYEVNYCFMPDWGSVAVQYQPGNFSKDLLQHAAKSAIAQYATDQINDPVTSKPVLGMYQMDFWTVDKHEFGDHGPRKLIRVDIGDRGLWYLIADDTADCRAALDTAKLVKKREQ